MVSCSCKITHFPMALMDSQIWNVSGWLSPNAPQKHEFQQRLDLIAMNGNSWGNTNLLEKSGKETPFLGLSLETWPNNVGKKSWVDHWGERLECSTWHSGTCVGYHWPQIGNRKHWWEIGFKLIKIWLKPSIAPKWIVANVRCFFKMYQLRPFVIPKWIHNAQWIAVCFQVKVYLGWVKAAKFCFGICEDVAISVSNCQALRCWCFSSCFWFHLLCFSRPLKSWGTLGGISSAIFSGFVWFVLTFLTWWTRDSSGRGRHFT